MSLRAVSLLIFALASIVITSAIIPAFAVQVDTLMIPKRGKADVFYKSVNIFYFEFPNGGKLQSLLQNVDDQIAFTADKDTPGVTELINKINNNLVNQKNSPVIVEDIKVDYKAKLKGQEKRSVLEHNLKMDIVISDFVMFTGSTSEGTLIDLNWRGLHVDEPVVLKTEEYGDFDINFPSGYYYAKYPGLMKEVENTAAMDILGKPTIDLRELTDLPIDKWAWLFDPSGSIKESEQFGFTEVGGANLITFFAYGESNVQTGVLRERTMKVDFAIDGIDYEMRSTSPPSNASIQIAGYATESIQGSDESALVFEFVPEGAGKSYTGGFPIVVLAVLGGMMGAVAGFVLWRANKK
ncbi:MAG: hypothetical protein ACE5KA_01725 [Nitrososphaerales archaeon]